MEATMNHSPQLEDEDKIVEQCLALAKFSGTLDGSDGVV